MEPCNGFEPRYPRRPAYQEMSHPTGCRVRGIAESPGGDGLDAEGDFQKASKLVWNPPPRELTYFIAQSRCGGGQEPINAATGIGDRLVIARQWVVSVVPVGLDGVR